MKEFEHGGTIFHDTITDFSVNLNALGMPKGVKYLLKNCKKLASIYPEVFAEKFEEAIAKKYNQNINSIISGNGATELISLVLKLFSASQKIMIFPPTYNDYKRAIEANYHDCIEVMRNHDNDFALTPEMLNITIEGKKPRVVIIGRPNNPVGKSLLGKELEQIIKNFPKTLFVLDESFIQFSRSYKELSLLENMQLENCVIIRSLTKFYSIPGLRLGFMVINENLKKKLLLKRLPWSVNGIASEAGIIALEDLEFENKSSKFYSIERKRIFKKYSMLKNVKVYAPQANFLTLEILEDCTPLYKYLLTKNIHIRRCENFNGLNNFFIRFAIRNIKENNRLFKEIKKWQKL